MNRKMGKRYRFRTKKQQEKKKERIPRHLQHLKMAKILELCQVQSLKEFFALEPHQIPAPELTSLEIKKTTKYARFVLKHHHLSDSLILKIHMQHWQEIEEWWEKQNYSI